MKKHIAGLFGFALLLATASAHAQITQTVRVQVPFTVTRAQTTIKLGATSWGYLIVPVAINGSGPYPFLLDTGSNRTLVRNELLDTLGVSSKELLPVNMAANVSYLHPTVAESVTVAGLSVHGLEVEGIDADQISRLRISIQGGMLPTSIFDRLFISHAGGYAIANPRSLKPSGDAH